MANLKTIQEAVKQNIPLRQAEENLNIDKEKENKDKELNSFMSKIGVNKYD